MRKRIRREGTMESIACLAEKQPFWLVGKIVFFTPSKKPHFFETQQTRINIGRIG